MDLLPGLSSFFVCLFYRLEVGILFGVFIQMIGLVYSSARPKVVVEVVKVRIAFGIRFYMGEITNRGEGGWFQIPKITHPNLVKEYKKISHIRGGTSISNFNIFEIPLYLRI